MSSFRERVREVTSRPVFRDSMSVVIAVGAFAISFGAIAQSAGFSLWQTMALSLLMFSGGSQFALVGVVAGGGSPWAGATAALLLGSRNAFYGLRISGLLKLRGWRRAVAAQVVIDESAALSMGRDTDRDNRIGFYATGIGVFVLWNLGTVIGVLGAGGPGRARLRRARSGSVPGPVGAAAAGPGAVGGRTGGSTPGNSGDPGHPARRAGPGGRSLRHPGRCLAAPEHGSGTVDARAGCELMLWAAILVASVGCYLFKLAGMSVPASVLARPAVQRVAALLPVVMLSALIAVQTVGSGQALVFDARLAGIAVAGVAIWRRAPFLVVLILAAGTTALIRWLFS